MTGDRWQRLRELFNRAVELDPVARTELLDRECADDPELRREVESLIEHSEPAEAALPQLVGQALDGLPGGGTCPATIGPYRVESRLGHGGMGAVYLASRSDQPFHRRVAVKLLRTGLADTELAARFRSERQILATLEHPNIARLIDGGATSDGTPYLVMEYVEGERLDDWCDARRVGIEARLELFRTVCAAVQAAHRRLVVHRDLKPANILVTAEGEPKLLDFGIAKLLAPEEHGHTVAVTRTLDRLLTPAYASPEQVRGEPVTTASDVYALGVLLYELLTGRAAHQFGSSTSTDIERVVCSVEPARPSMAVRRAADTAAAAARGLSVERLARRLTGDLDTIVMTALRKEPERRYGSVEALANDLGRHLEGLPVSARPDTVVYRVGKFAARHRTALTVTAVAFLAVSGLAVNASIQARRAAAERDRARAAEERAQVEAATATSVSDFLVDLFRVADPAEARGREVTAREILDRGASRVRTELAGQPEVQASLLDTIGRVYRNLGLFEPAAEVLSEALDLRRHLADDPLAVAATLDSLAEIRYEQGDLDQAADLAETALATARRQADGRNLITARALAMLGELAVTQGRLSDGEASYREALSIRRQVAGDDSLPVAHSLVALGELAVDLDRPQEAEDDLREALRITRTRLGPDHPDVLATLSSLISVIQEERPDDAVALGEEALALAHRLYPEPHPTLCGVLADHSRSLRKALRYDEAATFAGEAVSCERAVRGDNHPFVAWALLQRGSSLTGAGRYAEAEADLRQALAIYRANFPEPEGQTAGVLARLGRLLMDSGRPAEAEPYLRESLAIYSRLFPAGHSLVVELDAGVGLSLAGQGRWSEALPRLRRGLAAMVAAGHGDSRVATEIRTVLADAPPDQ